MAAYIGEIWEYGQHMNDTQRQELALDEHAHRPRPAVRLRQQLELHEYTAILNYLVNTAYAQFRDHDSRSKFKHPKVFYDDAVL